MESNLSRFYENIKTPGPRPWGGELEYPWGTPNATDVVYGKYSYEMDFSHVTFKKQTTLLSIDSKYLK